MSTRIFDLDLDAPPAAAVPLDGHERLWMIAWRDGAPAGAALLEPRERPDAITPEELEHALEAMQAPKEPTTATGDAALPSVSVVICTRNRPDRLPIALQALREQTHPFELVIVDNTPGDDRTRRVVEEQYPGATYVVEPTPGLPRARNTGVRAAHGGVLAFTDDDCRPVAGWVETIARGFATAPEVGCVTGPILPLELETPAQEAMEERGGFNRGYERVVYAPDADGGPVYPVQAWQFGAGGSMALSRECLDAIGGFDEALWRSEDMDIFYWALRRGYSIAFEPGAAVRHRHLPTWRQLARRMFDWGWGYLTYLDKIARTDTPYYAARARQERRNWLKYQLGGRVLPALAGRGGLPLPLVLLEVTGGLAGLLGYGAARRVQAP